MRHTYQDFIHQLLGKTNLFGYTRTIINRIRLVSWFLGEFYFSNAFTQRITWFWISFNVFTTSIVVWHSASYIFLTSRLDTSTLLTVNEVLITVLSLLLLVPIGSYLYQSSIANTLKSLDQFNDPELPVVSNQRYNWNEAYVAGCVQLFFCTAFIVTTYYDLVIDYDPNKLRNPHYYIYPLYCENITTMSEFLLETYLQIVSCVPVTTMYFIFPFFSVIVMKEFENKFQTLNDFLDCKSKSFQYDYEKLVMSYQPGQPLGVGEDEKSQMEDSFLNDIHTCARYHHRLLRGLDHLRLYIEFHMSINLFFFLFIEIFLIYLFTLMKDDQIQQKARYIEHAAVICIMFVINCWVGKSYTDMGEAFNETVYSVPWYYLSASSRKSVHLLLFQAQVTVQFNAWKIYPLNMAFFMRSCNKVYSIVNLLRRGITYKF